MPNLSGRPRCDNCQRRDPVLGTADYGTFTINKAISIVNGGGFEAGIMVPSQGTVINAGPNDAVNLRGLTIEGGPPARADSGRDRRDGSSVRLRQRSVAHLDDQAEAVGRATVSVNQSGLRRAS